MPPIIFLLGSEKIPSIYLCNKIERSGFDIARFINIESILTTITIMEAILPHLIIINTSVEIPSLELINKIRKNEKLINVPVIFLVDEECGENCDLDNLKKIILLRYYTHLSILIK